MIKIWLNRNTIHIIYPKNILNQYARKYCEDFRKIMNKIDKDNKLYFIKFHSKNIASIPASKFIKIHIDLMLELYPLFETNIESSTIFVSSKIIKFFIKNIILKMYKPARPIYVILS